MAAFLLKWNKFPEHIVGSLDDLRLEEDFTDVTLVAENGKQVLAHKVLLSVCSSYFKDTFKKNPCKHPVIIFNGVNFQILQVLIDFIYHGEVNITEDLLPSFFQTAKLLQIKGLTDVNEDGENVVEPNSQSRHSRSVSPLVSQNTYGFPSTTTTSNDPTIDSINPILKSLSNLASTPSSSSSSKANKRPRLQPGNSALSTFVNFINPSTDTQVPPATIPVIGSSNNHKVGRPSNGTKTNLGRPSTNGNVVDSNNLNNSLTSNHRDLNLHLNQHLSDSVSKLTSSISNGGGDHFSHNNNNNTMTIKNEQGEFIYEKEEFPIMPVPPTCPPPITRGQVDSLLLDSAPNYIRRTNSNPTTLTSKQGHHNEMKMGRNESNSNASSGFLEEALLGRKRSSINNFNVSHNYHPHYNFLKPKETKSTQHNNHNTGPPKLHREVPLLNSTTTTFSPSFRNQQQNYPKSQSPSQSKTNLTVDQSPKVPFSKSSPLIDNTKMPIDLEVEKVNANKSQNAVRGTPPINKIDLPSQDEFMSQLNLLRNQSTATTSATTGNNNNVPPVPSVPSSSSASSSSMQQTSPQKYRATLPKHGSSDNFNSNNSYSRQLLKSAKATVRAKEKQQQGQSGASSLSKTQKANFIKNKSKASGSSQSKKDDSDTVHNRNDTGSQGPYSCSLCHKTYVHHRSLNDHKKSHTGATRCPACHKSFSKVANLRAHIAAQHRSDQPIGGETS